MQHLTMQFFKKDTQTISDDNELQQNFIDSFTVRVLLIVLYAKWNVP